MENIIWLASYPKSGNTWLRIFLANLHNKKNEPININDLGNEWEYLASCRSLFDESIGLKSTHLTVNELSNLRPEAIKFFAAGKSKSLYIKIHDALLPTPAGDPIIPFSATKGIIYLIRNPLDVAISLANHYGASIDKAIEHMGNKQYATSHFKNFPGEQLPVQLSSWSDHVESWTTQSQCPIHIVKYEDMLNNPYDSFSTIVQFLKLPNSSLQIRKAVESTAFANLKKQEMTFGFTEKPGASTAFFHSGTSGKWKTTLSNKQIDTIVNNHNLIMGKLGYLNDI